MTSAQIGDVLARLNAGLNTASFILLLLGFLAIKGKQTARHQRLMFAAFITSALFLTSYLTRFAITGAHHINASGAAKAVYFTLLFSHMILAAAAVPLILRALFLAYKKRFDEHRKIAKITFPIWAYVSLTGVVVYVMLYQVYGTAPAAPTASVEAHAPAADVRLPLPDFTLTTEQNKPFGLADMKGRVWVADFVFTTCPTVCPKLTKRMVEVQERTRALGDAVHLATFSVDPENDTPDKLAAYARQYSADPARWTFLTGSLAQIEGTVVGGFKIVMGKKEAEPGGTLMTIFHGEKFVLVDREANIRGYFDADDEGIRDLLRRVTTLAGARASR